MLYFESCYTINELKLKYRRLALRHHPDCGGNEATMKAINAEYETAFQTLKRQHNAEAKRDKTKHATTEAPAEFIHIINALLRLHGLTVELCGSWVWVGGETKAHKDALRNLGCRYAPQKKLWSWHHVEAGEKRYNGKKTMSEIRLKYGSATFAPVKEDSLQAV